MEFSSDALRPGDWGLRTRDSKIGEQLNGACRGDVFITSTRVSATESNFGRAIRTRDDNLIRWLGD